MRGSLSTPNHERTGNRCYDSPFSEPNLENEARSSQAHLTGAKEMVSSQGCLVASMLLGAPSSIHAPSSKARSSVGSVVSFPAWRVPNGSVPGAAD